MKLEEEEVQGLKDRFVPLLTSSLTVSTPNPPAYYDAELIRDGLTYRGKLHRDGGASTADGANQQSVFKQSGMRRFTIHDEASRRYEGICFSNGMVAMHALEDDATSTYTCLDHLLKVNFQQRKVTVAWLDA
jgi:hypothetical protein